MPTETTVTVTILMVVTSVDRQLQSQETGRLRKDNSHDAGESALVGDVANALGTPYQGARENSASLLVSTTSLPVLLLRCAANAVFSVARLRRKAVGCCVVHQHNPNRGGYSPLSHEWSVRIETLPHFAFGCFNRCVGRSDIDAPGSGWHRRSGQYGHSYTDSHSDCHVHSVAARRSRGRWNHTPHIRWQHIGC